MRRIVWEVVNDVDLPSHVRMRTVCGDPLCVSEHHVSVPNDGLLPGDFTELECPLCAYRLVLNKVTDAAWCTSRGSVWHRARRMTPLTISAGNAV